MITDIAHGEVDLDTLKAGASLIPVAKITKVPKVVKAIGNVGKTGFKKGKEGEKIAKSGQAKQTKAKNKGGRGATKKPTSPNQLQQQVKRGKVPKGISRVDSSDPNIPNSQPHIHFGENESALNLDGTRHDAGKERPNITNKIKEWILDNGWNLPVE